MYATDTVSVAAKLAAFVLAAIASAIVLGTTVSGFQPHEDVFQDVVALEHVIVTAARSN